MLLVYFGFPLQKPITCASLNEFSKRTNKKQTYHVRSFTTSRKAGIQRYSNWFEKIMNCELVRLIIEKVKGKNVNEFSTVKIFLVYCTYSGQAKEVKALAFLAPATNLRFFEPANASTAVAFRDNILPCGCRARVVVVRHHVGAIANNEKKF